MSEELFSVTPEADPVCVRKVMTEVIRFARGLVATIDFLSECLPPNQAEAFVSLTAHRRNDAMAAIHSANAVLSNLPQS